MKKRRIIVSVASFLLLLASCQPTPQSAAVVNKGDGALQETIGSTAAPAQEYSAPGSWKESIYSSDGRIGIDLDAEVLVPEAIMYPVLRVEPDEITQDEANTYMDILIGGAEIKSNLKVLTKADIETEIMAIQKSISDPNSDFNQLNEKGTREYEEKLADKQSELKAWQDQWATAPDEDERASVSREFREEEGYDMLKKIEGQVEMDDTPDGTAYLQVYKEMPDFYRQAIRFFKDQQYNFVNLRQDITGLKGISITIDDAKIMAEQYLTELGIENMMFSYACSAYETAYMDQTITDAPQCFILFFTRSVNGVPVTYQESGLDIEALSKQYAPYWPQEYIMIGVNDKGVRGIEWVSPTKVIDTVNENVVLLEFERIQEIFRDSIDRSINLITIDSAVTEYMIHIDQVKLGLSMVREKDTNGFILIPTWNFFGYQISEYPDDPSLGSYSGKDYREHSVGHSFLTINAIDGSIIDPALGY